VTPSTAIRRKPERGTTDLAVVHAVLDEALFADVGLVRDGWPVVLPTVHGRIDDVVYLHGSPAAGMLRDGRKGVPVCVTATVVDGLVLATAIRNHSMNYRSAVVYGTARRVTEIDEKVAALRALTERVTPGRWDEARPMTDRELREVEVIAVPIEAASAKVRVGPPGSTPEDEGHDHVWTGVIPVSLVRGEPVRS
jgi:uncharacterized protein